MILPPSPTFYPSLNPALASKLDGAKVENLNKMFLEWFLIAILAYVIISLFFVFFSDGNINDLCDLLGFNILKRVLKKIKRIIKRR